MNQMQNLPGSILIFDMRSRFNYYHGHLENSICLPLDQFSDESFLKWDPSMITSKVITIKEKKKLFDDRKRKFIYIIASQDSLISEVDFRIPSIFSRDMILKYFNKYGI